jgi:hypothetical protein
MKHATHAHSVKKARTAALLIAVMLAGAAADLLQAAGHAPAGPLSLPGFWSLFGLLGCFSLAGACKLAARFLKRPEKYYDDDL